MSLAGVLFDLDGVIADSEGLGCAVAVQVSALFGISLSEEDLRRFVGISDREFYNTLQKKLPSFPSQRATEEHERIYNSRLNDVRPVPGAIQLARACATAGLKLGVVTGSTREQCQRLLEQFNIHSLFTVVVTCEDVLWGKPDAAGYRTAVRKLELQEHQIIALEDSTPGVVAAKRADLKVIFYRPDESLLDAERYGADLIVKSLLSLSVLQLQDAARPELLNNSCEAMADAQSTLNEFRIKILSAGIPFDSESPWSIVEIESTDPILRLLQGHSVPITDVWAFFGQPLTNRLQEIGFFVGSSELALFEGHCVLMPLRVPIMLRKPVKQRSGTWRSRDVYFDATSIKYVLALDRLFRDYKPRAVLELGTGTGFFLIRAAIHGAEICEGIDIQPEAVRVAKLNAAMNDVAATVRVVLGDFRDEIAFEGRFDLVTFHPPYRIVPPMLQYPNPVQRIGVGAYGLHLARDFIDHLPRVLADRGCGALYLQVPSGPGCDALPDLLAHARNRGLATMWLPEQDYRIDDIVTGIAAKFTDSDAALIQNAVKRYFEELRISFFQSGILEVRLQ